MNLQPSLFVSGSETSRKAAEAIQQDAPTLRAKVLDFIRSRGTEGATDEQIQLIVGINPSTERPRRVELVRGGFIKDSGMQRRTLSGRQAVVWVGK